MLSGIDQQPPRYDNTLVTHGQEEKKSCAEDDTFAEMYFNILDDSEEDSNNSDRNEHVRNKIINIFRGLPSDSPKRQVIIQMVTALANMQYHRFNSDCPRDSIEHPLTEIHCLCGELMPELDCNSHEEAFELIVKLNQDYSFCFSKIPDCISSLIGELNHETTLPLDGKVKQWLISQKCDLSEVKLVIETVSVSEFKNTTVGRFAVFPKTLFNNDPKCIELYEFCQNLTESFYPDKEIVSIYSDTMKIERHELEFDRLNKKEQFIVQVIFTDNADMCGFLEFYNKLETDIPVAIQLFQELFDGQLSHAETFFIRSQSAYMITTGIHFNGFKEECEFAGYDVYLPASCAYSYSGQKVENQKGAGSCSIIADSVSSGLNHLAQHNGGVMPEFEFISNKNINMLSNQVMALDPHITLSSSYAKESYYCLPIRLITPQARIFFKVNKLYLDLVLNDNPDYGSHQYYKSMNKITQTDISENYLNKQKRSGEKLFNAQEVVYPNARKDYLR